MKKATEDYPGLVEVKPDSKARRLNKKLGKQVESGHYFQKVRKYFMWQEHLKSME